MTRKELKTSIAYAISHPVPPGATVSIFRVALAGRPFIEGRAVVVHPVAGEPHTYVVRFIGEARTCVRLVWPGDFQKYPGALLAILVRAWRASMEPSLLDEFDVEPVRGKRRA